MKTLLTSLTILTLLIHQSSAQGNNYVSSMEKEISLLYSSKSADDYKHCAETFEKFTRDNPKEWLPYYYASFAYARMTLQTEDPKQKDALLDKAEALADKAEKIAGENSELNVLRCMIVGLRINVDPGTRGRTMGMISLQFLEQAKKLDPNNPRAFLLQGQTLFYTPEQWGGGKDAALPVLEDALEKFNSFKSTSSISPSWGKTNCEDFIAKCKNGE